MYSFAKGEALVKVPVGIKNPILWESSFTG